MSNFKHVLGFVGAFAAVQANAQSNPSPNPFLEEHGTPPPSMVEFDGDNIQGGVFNSKKYGSGISGRFVFENGQCGLVLDAKVAQHDRDALIAAGCDIVDRDNTKTTLLFGGAWRETDLSHALSDPLIPENTDGKGKQLFLTVINSGEKRSFAFTARAGETDDTELYRETRLLGTETTTTRQRGYMVTRRTDTFQDYLTTAEGNKWVNAQVRGTFVIGDTSEITLALGREQEWSGKNHENTDISAIGDIQWRTSFDTGSLVLGANRYGNQNGLTVSWEAPVWNGKAGYRVELARIGDDTRAGVNFVIPLGGNAYTAPRYGKSLAERNLSNALSEAADNQGNHVSDASQRYTVVKETVGGTRVVTTETGSTEIPNSRFDIGGTTCTLTRFVEGGTTTCTLTPTDPDGIASVTATLGGSPVPVTFDGTRYTISLANVPVGTHLLTWTGRGKKPDGTPEDYSETAYETIVVTSANKPPVPTFTDITFNASLSANVSGKLTATDENTGDKLTYALVTPPSSGNMMVNADGSFTITGTIMPGTYTFTYSVTDGKSDSVPKIATLTVNDVAPTCTQSNIISSIDDDGGSTGNRVIGTYSCSDALGRPIIHTVEIISYTGQQPYTGPINLTVDSNGNVSIAPFDINGPANLVYRDTATPQGGTKSTVTDSPISLVDTI